MQGCAFEVAATVKVPIRKIDLELEGHVINGLIRHSRAKGVRFSYVRRTDIKEHIMINFSKAGLVAVIVAMALSTVLGEMKQMNEDWYEVNDDVMGGISQSRADMKDDGALLFDGVVSFENNGGFASIRRTAEPLELEGTSGIRLRIKGDGKSYQFRVRTSQQFDGVAYKHDFATVMGDWSEVELKWEDFIATFRGRGVPGAQKLNASMIEQVGFLIADKQEGVFSLEIASMNFM